MSVEVRYHPFLEHEVTLVYRGAHVGLNVSSVSSHQLATDEKRAAAAIVSVAAEGCAENEANPAKLPARPVLHWARVLSLLQDTTSVKQVNAILKIKKTNPKTQKESDF